MGSEHQPLCPAESCKSLFIGMCDILNCFELHDKCTHLFNDSLCLICYDRSVITVVFLFPV